MNQNNISNYSNSSCYLDYSDYTTTSAKNYNDIFRIIFIQNIVNEEIFKIPNSTTNLAIFEARNHLLIKEHHSVSDFFDDLED